MSEILDLSKSVHDLAKEHPGFVQVMAGLGFTDITKPAALNTVGRVMTVPGGCNIKGIGLADAIAAFEAAGYTVVDASTASAPAEDSAESDSDADADADAAANTRTEAKTDPQVVAKAEPQVEAKAKPQRKAKEEAPQPAPASPENPSSRTELLQSYIARLSSGEDLESVRADFVANFKDVDAAEIARAEQTMIEGGAPIAEVQRLCDVHSALFHGATREEQIANAENAVMDSIASGSGSNDFNARVLASIPGHPVHVLAAENDAISTQLKRVEEALEATVEADSNNGESASQANDTLTAELQKLAQLGRHYAKKGDLVYPILKLHHGYSGPSDVMWGVDDEIRDELRALLGASDRNDAWRDRLQKVLTRANEMVYKEANILLPLCANNFTDDEWLQMYVDMKGYDLCLIDEAGTWKTGEAYFERWAQDAEAGKDCSDAEVKLPSGHMNVAQLDALLNTIPLEITFIDGNEINRYWNDDGQKKLFKRPPSALDREVWACHPPKVQPMVRQVISTLKSGARDSFDIWMQKEGEPVLVRYMAVRDRSGAYLGTMEVVQRMGFAQQHFQE